MTCTCGARFAGMMTCVCKPAGQKNDQGKDDWDLVPWRSMKSVVRVLMQGAAKYGRENWRSVPDAKLRYANALLRHYVSWKMGERADPEDGLPHLAHLICCALFLLDFEEGSHELPPGTDRP